MKRALPVLAALALAGCVTPGTSASPRLGEVGLVNGFRVRPLRVVEDSRCPINARCIWAGRIIVRTEIRDGAARELRNLELGRPQPVFGGTIALVSAEPGKLAGAPTDPRAYRFTFEITR